MVQVRVKTRGMDFEQMARELGVNIKELKKDVMEDMATEIAVNSPVHSGYYARNHEVRLRSGSFQANKTKPDNAPKETNPDSARQEGLNNMFADIQSLDLSKDTFVFRNKMAYSGLIEAGETGNKTGVPPVYASAVRESSRIIQEAIQNMKSRTR